MEDRWRAASRGSPEKMLSCGHNNIVTLHAVVTSNIYSSMILKPKVPLPLTFDVTRSGKRDIPSPRSSRNTEH